MKSIFHIYYNRDTKEILDSNVLHLVVLGQKKAVLVDT